MKQDGKHKPQNRLAKLQQQVNRLRNQIKRIRRAERPQARPGITTNARGFGWIPDLPDQRDHLYIAPRKTMAALPPSTDLRAQCPPVYDQGDLGSCTANAVAGAHQFSQIKQSEPKVFSPSRLFIYYNERVIEHTVNSDSGAMIRDGMKSVGRRGVCPERIWPYDIAKFTDRPPAKSYKNALSHRAVSYRRVQRSLSQMQGCLAEGFPFILGFTVYESFESDAVAATGVVPMPRQNEAILGGHAVLAVGYDDSKRRFLMRNSWGTQWGMAGYFTMPYAYLLEENLADDFWTLRVVK